MKKKAPKCPCPLRLLPDSSGFVTAFKTILPASYLTSLFDDMLAALPRFDWHIAAARIIVLT